MIAALLILIVLVLLFGAGAVKGWIKGALGWGAAALILLLAIGFVGTRYKRVGEAREHAELVAMAKPMILRDVATKAGSPADALVDVVSYDRDGELYLCGSVAGTRGFGGPDGRRRFLSNGGNTEIEQLKASERFDERVALHCTLNPDAAMMR